MGRPHVTAPLRNSHCTSCFCRHVQLAALDHTMDLVARAVERVDAKLVPTACSASFHPNHNLASTRCVGCKRIAALAVGPAARNVSIPQSPTTVGIHRHVLPFFHSQPALVVAARPCLTDATKCALKIISKALCSHVARHFDVGKPGTCLDGCSHENRGASTGASCKN